MVQAFVRVSYNKGSDVIITVSGSASRLRGSESFTSKQLFPGYRPMGLSKDPARSKFIMDKYSVICKNTAWAPGKKIAS